MIPLSYPGFYGPISSIATTNWMTTDEVRQMSKEDHLLWRRWKDAPLMSFEDCMDEIRRDSCDPFIYAFRPATKHDDTDDEYVLVAGYSIYNYGLP